MRVPQTPRALGCSNRVLLLLPALERNTPGCRPVRAGGHAACCLARACGREVRESQFQHDDQHDTVAGGALPRSAPRVLGRWGLGAWERGDVKTLGRCWGFGVWRAGTGIGLAAYACLLVLARLHLTSWVHPFVAGWVHPFVAMCWNHDDTVWV